MKKRIMNFLMLSCRTASSLVDKKHLFGLSMREHLMLGMHTSMCEFCTAYKKQSALIDALLYDIHGDNIHLPIIGNDQLKKRIASEL
jgi:hypothetical protein